MISLAIGTFRAGVRLRKKVLDYAAEKRRQIQLRREEEARRLAGFYDIEEGAEEEELTDDEEQEASDDEEKSDDGPRDMWGALQARLPEQEVTEVEEDNGLTEWDEILDDDEIEALELCVKKLNPNYVPAAEVEFEADIIAEVKRRRNPLLKFNAILSFGEGARAARGLGVEGSGYWASMPGKQRVRHIPRMVVVTGHTLQRLGNMGINGIYERYPEDYHGRPVYQKFMERRNVHPFQIDEAGDYIHDPEDDERRVWKPRTLESQVLSRRYQKGEKLPVYEQPPPFPNLMWTKDAWFFFFDDHRGAWCIGPAVGATEVFAKCFALEQAVPHHLKGWEIWDAGVREWFSSEAMQAVKAG